MACVATSACSKPHVVLLSSPGLGHLIPVLELGKRLVAVHNLDITIFIVASGTSAAESQVLQSAMSPKLFEVVELPPADISSLIKPDTAVVTKLCVMMREIIPALRSAISALNVRPAALIVDLFGTEAMAVADELHMRKYVFIASNAWFLALTIYMPVLDRLVHGEYVEKEEPFTIPGCRSVLPEDVVDPMLDRSDQQYLEYVRMGAEIPMCDGILVSTWEDLERTTLDALRENQLLGNAAKAPVYAIGPSVRATKQGGSTNELFLWLDAQPSESLVFISLGSGGTLSFEQMTEMAWGLEMSQQRFIWVVRMPTIKTGGGSAFTTASGDDYMSRFFPDGFLTRTQKVGLVLPDWAPQADILKHPSVGAFLSHCGWNSTLESVTNGVPMIAWPLYSEQKMNSTLLEGELGIAIRPKVLPSREVVGRQEIEKMIRKIMVDEEGTNIRKRVKEVKASSERALNKGGSSYNALSMVARECHESRKCHN